MLRGIWLPSDFGDIVGFKTGVCLPVIFMYKNCLCNVYDFLGTIVCVPGFNRSSVLLFC